MATKQVFTVIIKGKENAMKQPNEDMYITMLKFGRDCGASGEFMRDNVIAHLQETGHLTDEDLTQFKEEYGKIVSERCPKYRMIDPLMKEAYERAFTGLEKKPFWRTGLFLMFPGLCLFSTP